MLRLTGCLPASQGSLSAIEAGAGRAGVFHNVGPAAKLAPDTADAELRRLQQEVCPCSPAWGQLIMLQHLCRTGNTFPAAALSLASFSLSRFCMT